MFLFELISTAIQLLISHLDAQPAAWTEAGRNALAALDVEADQFRVRRAAAQAASAPAEAINLSNLLNLLNSLPTIFADVQPAITAILALIAQFKPATQPTLSPTMAAAPDATVTDN